MPYKLRKAPRRDLYWVVNKRSGRKYSRSPLPRSRASAQMRALYARESGYPPLTRRSMRGGSKGSRKMSCYGGKRVDVKRAAILGATTGLLTRNAGVGVGVAGVSAAYDYLS